jgi:hypothetical protein
MKNIRKTDNRQTAIQAGLAPRDLVKDLEFRLWARLFCCPRLTISF